LSGVRKSERIALRRQLGSQREVAGLIGVTRETVSRYERDPTAPRMYELSLMYLRHQMGEKQKPRD
jgi:transcriptional regulator with XRE-family HTH domain